MLLCWSAAEGMPPRAFPANRFGDGSAAFRLANQQAWLELRRELLGDGAGKGIGYDVHVLGHVSPGFRLAGIILGLQLLDLGDVVATMRLQEALNGVLRQEPIGDA